MFITYIIKFNLYEYITQTFEIDGAGAWTLMAAFILVSAAAAYMLGSLNFGIIISRLWFHDDIRKYGSGNAGATNMLRVWGKGPAGLTLLCDMLKCFAAVVIGVLLMGDIGGATAGLFCVVGHVFPCWHRFKGGKGVASTAMVAILASPVVFGLLAVVFVVIVTSTRYVSLASIMFALLFPLLLSSLTGPGPHFLMAFCASVIVLVMHRENMKRLLNKTEPQIDTTQFRFRKKRTEETLPDDGSASESSAETVARDKNQGTKNTSRKKLKRRKQAK
ncbi:MAG: glycerol-3-phosphate 1-O-acyltransferase PlsY [Eubacteriales bacterium]|jgi:glycerol-3-phosphate acyltransferase PlsY